MKISIVGDIILDKYVIGDVDRISPEAPVPIIKEKSIFYRLGGAANVAANLVSLGKSVNLFGIIGKDIEGKLIKKLIKQNKINFHSRISKLGSILKTRYISNNSQLLRVDRENKYNHFTSRLLFNNLKKDKSKIIIFSDYDKGTLSVMSDYIKKNNDKIFLVDPKSTNFTKYSGSFVITPNLKEISNIIGYNLSKKIFIKECQNLRKKLNIKYLIVTMGSEGVVLFSSTNEYTKFSTVKTEVTDITGAGDTFLATLSYYLSKKKSITICISQAVKAATLSVSKFGTSTINIKEIE
jgi:D-beta-D-heptose 7-phosphate kinase/D-beta-D-heptose 1-phosphate adenosyltransferase